MEQNLRIEGIYDQRTLKHLKLKGLKAFCFDFSPKSFNFIQEHIFLEQLLSLVESEDRLFFHFSRSNDPMIAKLISDLKNHGVDLGRVYFEFDEWSIGNDPKKFENNYLLKYASNTDFSKLIGDHFKGFIFDFEMFEDLHQKNLLNNFANNFYTRFHNKLENESLMILKIDWHSNMLSSLLDLFEFDIFSFSINSKIEICYRNVDLKKLNDEMEIFKKNTQSLQDI
ncbi:MAG: hypothetical protein ACXVLQ_06105 [Bacteriovorax sp.]